MKRVLSYRQLPSPPPTLLALVVYLYLDRFQASGWLWGMSITILVIFFLSWGYTKWNETAGTIIFKEDEKKS